jgi:hypothetical protein
VAIYLQMRHNVRCLKRQKNENLNDNACIIQTKCSQLYAATGHAVIRHLKCGPELVFFVTRRYQNVGALIFPGYIC